MDKTCILNFCQKVFDVGLGKQLDFPCHEAWHGQMAWENKRFHQDWVHLGKVANATFVNPRNQQKWTYVDLVEHNTSPWCTTWCTGLIWSYEHAHKSWGQGEKVGSTNLLKLGSEQKGLWGILVDQNDLDWSEALQDHHNMHLWLAGFLLDFYWNISFRNISNPWNW